ncbi:MAG: hypothetical protein ACI3X6_03410 [Alloprevotella sp.]
MSVKIISKIMKNCSLIVSTKCLKVKIPLLFTGILKELNSVVLIIPKLARCSVLTIANAPLTLCAGSEAALTGFCLHLAS